MPITLWRPTGQAELDLVAESGWRDWPPRRPAAVEAGTIRFPEGNA